MKLLRNAAILANGLLLAAMLGACHNESVMTPQVEAQVTDRNAKTGAAPLLAKDGSRILEYSTNAFGRRVLSKLIDQMSNQYFTFTYSTQSVQVKSYVCSTNNFLTEFAYKLDADGRCIESTFGNKVYGFEYNAEGRLSKRFSKIDANERAEFVYSLYPGNIKALHKILFYDKLNVKFREVTYNYGTIADLSLINPDSFFESTALYLPIFGKFNTNLPSMMYEETGPTNNKVTQNWLLDYTLNADGFVKTLTKKSMGTNSIATTERKYLYPIAGI